MTYSIGLRIVFKKSSHLEQFESDLAFNLGSELHLLLQHKRLNDKHMHVKCEVLTAMLVKIHIFWDVTSVDW